jgi:hypothetical protein
LFWLSLRLSGDVVRDDVIRGNSLYNKIYSLVLVNLAHYLSMTQIHHTSPQSFLNQDISFIVLNNGLAMPYILNI